MTAPASIVLPEAVQGLTVIASVSGGKDSTALILALREAGIPARFVFADTGWEHLITYDYLDYLRETLQIAIDVVGIPGGMRARIRHRAGFPGRMQRWCTRELKIEPLRAYHDQVIAQTGIETVSAMGVRADESQARSQLGELDDEPEGARSWGGYIWRPLLRWTIDDVLRLHNRHAVKVNPLYLLGFNRVGCKICIYESKEGIALNARLFPEVIDEIRELEVEALALRHARNLEQPGRYKHVDDASYFQTQRKGFTGIDAVVAWARTDHGGRQWPLLVEAPRGGCMRWGICDMPDVRDAPKPDETP